MSAGIVYEGVVPQDGSSGGTLFKGMKFWVSHHVPSRVACIQNIKSNGGEVVPIEKNANYLLVDHAKQNAPPGSYSWKFINDSIDAGTRKPIEDYLCTEAPRKARAVGSSLPQKGTRTPFTAQDDLILSKWVAENERLGVGIHGNTIYKEFEEKKSGRQGPPREEASAPEEPKDQSAPQVANGEEDENEDSNEIQELPLPEPSSARNKPSPMRSQEPEEGNPADSRLSSPKLPADRISVEGVTTSPYAEGIDLKGQFNEDYQAYRLSTDSQVQWWPTIRGITFELWQLWQAVRSQKVEPEERDWQQISEALGFNWVEDETIPDEVRQCFETHLGEFEVVLMEFEERSEDEDETQANAILEAPLPSSSPTLPPPKRSHATALGPDHLHLGSSPKRPRHNRDDEVPSTPDEKNGTSHLRRQTMPPRVGSPSLGSHENVNVTPSRKLAAEADAQGFGFQSEVDEQLESQVNITPSQQLRSEFDARSPAEIAVTPTPSRTARDPFIEEEDEPEDNTPRASTIASAKLKRRSLPQSFTQTQSPRASGSPASRPQQQDPSPTPADQDQDPSAKPQLKTRAPAKESLEDIVDFYMSLGYSQNVVVRSLDATTWVPGLASQLMEMLKRGESLPTNWRGVWTQKDDETLRAISTEDQPQNAKEKRKRDRQMEKLEKKHTREGMDTRAKFLETPAIGRRVRFAEGEGASA
ncbi:putative transcription factor protein [Eutypa lata UCREL1]|uniref:DNA-binding protein RAP1 n=1 Tax=Eutypa lata (strain UCR-EL1) TaxID=1287681 RepID=M7THY5_EUTLA|nr:putative transcription factor protein [Eutypa lata UCREL1]